MKMLAILLVSSNLAGACSAAGGRVDTLASARVDSARADTASPASTDDCVRGEPEPVLAGAGSARPAPRFERTGKLSAVEDLQVDDTTSLRIAHGGCAHYVESYTFSIRGATRDTTDSDYWLEYSAALLTALPVDERRRSQIAALTKTLTAEAAKGVPYVYGDPISIPELTTVTLVVTRKDAGVAIELVYDVAL